MKRANVVSVRTLFAGATRLRCTSSRKGFHWQPPQVAQLLVDVETSARDSADEEDVPEERLYLGVITTSRGKSGVSVLHDGQQRLVVLAMFLAFARDRVQSNTERNRLDRMLVRRAFARPPEPRLRLSAMDHAWFAHFILPPGATRRLPATAPLGSPRELLLAARFMEHAFGSYKPDELSNILDFLLHHTALVRSIADVAPPPPHPMLAHPMLADPMLAGSRQPAPSPHFSIAAE